MTDRLKRGDFVRIRLEGDDEWMDAFIGFASATDPSSVIVLFDGAVRTRSGGLMIGMLPVSVDYAAETATAMHGDNYEIEVREARPVAS